MPAALTLGHKGGDTKLRQRQRRGFTLIELMISTGVILMMLAVTLPAFIAFQRRQSLAIAAQQIRDVILETQNYALAPRGADEEDGGKDAGADLYRIVFVNTSDYQGYEIDEQQVVADQPLATQRQNPSWKLVKRGQLPHGISFRCFPSFTPATPVIFTLQAENPVIGVASENGKGLVYSISELGKIVRPMPTNGQIRIILQQQALEENYVVTIHTQTGRVDVEPNTDAGICA